MEQGKLMGKFFQFLKDKRGREIPLVYRIIYEPQSLTKEELNVPGNLNLRETKVKSLPEGLVVGGSLNLISTQ